MPEGNKSGIVCNLLLKNHMLGKENETFVLSAPMGSNRESNCVKTVTADDLPQQRISGSLINVIQKNSFGPDTLPYTVSRTVTLSIDIAPNIPATTAADDVTSNGDTSLTLDTTALQIVSSAVAGNSMTVDTINSDETINKTRAALTN